MPGYDYSESGTYFVTICTQDRKELFGNVSDTKITVNNIGLMVNYWWRQLPQKYPTLHLDEYIIMPNHLHGIIVLSKNGRGDNGQGNPAPTIGNIIGFFKYQTTKHFNDFVGAGFTRPKLWQRNYYERIIRDEKEFNHVRNYIHTNPANFNAV